MALIRDAPLLLADTGPLCRFAETDAIEALLAYLGDGLMIVREVEAELNYRADQPEHKSLRPYREQEPPYVAREAIDLDRTTRRNIYIVAERWHERDRRRGKPDRGPRANIGEIATVFAGQQQGVPVLMDDGDGRSFAAAKGLTIYTSEQLLAEMVAASRCSLRYRRGWLIYQRVYGNNEAAFAAAVADATARGA